MAFDDLPQIDPPSEHDDEAKNRLTAIFSQKAGFISREQVPDKGNDYLVELIEHRSAKNRHFCLQLKSVENPVLIDQGSTISFSWLTSRMGYIMRNEPIYGILVIYDVSSRKLYYEYVYELYQKLMERETDGWKANRYVNVHVPVANVLDSGAASKIHLKYLRQFNNLSKMVADHGASYDLPVVKMGQVGEWDTGSTSGIVEILQRFDLQPIEVNDLPIIHELITRLPSSEILQHKALCIQAALAYSEVGRIADSDFYLQRLRRRFALEHGEELTVSFIQLKNDYSLGLVDIDGFVATSRMLLDKTANRQAVSKVSLLFDRIENVYYKNDKAIPELHDFQKAVHLDDDVKDYINKNADIIAAKKIAFSEKELFDLVVYSSYLNKKKKLPKVDFHRKVLLGYRKLLVENFAKNPALDVNDLIDLYSIATFTIKKELSADYESIKSIEQPIVNRIATRFSDNKSLLAKRKLMANGKGSGKYKVTLLDQDGTYVGEFDCSSDVYILDAGLEAGFALPYSSRVGADAAACAWISMGTVDQSDGSYLSDCQIDYGFCLLDVSYPLSDVTVKTQMEERLIQCDLNDVNIHPEPTPFPVNPPLWPAGFVPDMIFQILLPGWQETSTPPEDPCDRLKKQIANQLSNALLSAQNTSIGSYSSNGGWEYGANEKLNSLIPGDYKSSPITTNQLNNGWLPNFSWNSTDGYSVGYSHLHTDGAAPSPEDVFWLYKNLSNPLLAAQYDQIFYKLNASFTTITNTGEVYLVTIADWDLLKARYDAYTLDPDKFDRQYNELADWYQRVKSINDQAEPTQFALKGKLGNAINLYKKNNETGKFEGIKFIDNIIQKINCPD